MCLGPRQPWPEPGVGHHSGTKTEVGVQLFASHFTNTWHWCSRSRVLDVGINDFNIDLSYNFRPLCCCRWLLIEFFGSLPCTKPITEDNLQYCYSSSFETPVNGSRVNDICRYCCVGLHPTTVDRCDQLEQSAGDVRVWTISFEQNDLWVNLGIYFSQ